MPVSVSPEPQVKILGSESFTWWLIGGGARTRGMRA